MNLEKEIFKKSIINFDKITKYGFVKKEKKYFFEKNFLTDFKAIISIDMNGIVKGKVIDLQINEEYLGLRTEIQGTFASKIKESYKDILIDIRNNCFDNKFFIFEQTNRINNYIKTKYNNEPEFLWESTPGCGVYRNKINNKWYGIIMYVDLKKISNESGEVEILNVKLDQNKIKKLLEKKGYYKAYHMNKKDWITIVLNDTLKDEEIFSLIDESYNIINGPTIWLVPANPKYYDIINCFNTTNEIMWKQSSDVSTNDIVYIYVGAPYSRVMYKCVALNVNIEYDYKDENLKINKLMKIKLIKKLKEDYTFEYLNKLGIKSIRGPRKISKEVSNHLK